MYQQQLKYCSDCRCLHAGTYLHACMQAPTCMHACRHRRLHAGGRPRARVAKRARFTFVHDNKVELFVVADTQAHA